MHEGYARMLGELELQDYKAALLGQLRFGGEVSVTNLRQYVVDMAESRGDDRPAYIKIAVNDRIIDDLRNTPRSALLLCDYPLEWAVNYYEQRLSDNRRVFRPGDTSLTPLGTSAKAEELIKQAVASEK